MIDTGPELHPVQRFFRMLKVDKRDIFYIYVYAIFSGLITLTLPLGIQAIIGLIIGGTISSAWTVLILIVTVGTALGGFLTIMQLTVNETLQRRIFIRSAFDFAFRIPRLDMEKLIGEYPPELVNRFFDTLTIQKGLPKILMDFSSSLLQIIFGLILLSFYHPFFVFFGLTLLIILATIFWITGPMGMRTSLLESKYKYRVVHWLEEIARSLSTFKLAGTSDLPLEKTDKEVTSYLQARRKHFRILLFQYGSIVGFKTLVTGGLLVLGSFLVVNNQINVGQFVASEIIVILIMGSVEKLILTMDVVYDVLTGLEKIGKVMDIPYEQGEGLCFEDIDTGKGMEIQVRDLKYKFDDSNKSILQGISFDAKPGEKICIAGYNASGKSTLIQVMAGLLKEFQGSILYNGIPFKNLNLVSLRSYIGDHTSQEDIFRGNIYENITLGHKHVSLEDVIRATEEVGLSEYIRAQPEGYNTTLMPEGDNIPGSIKTKIILARGVVSNPSLLAMEEMMAHLEQKDRVRIANLLTRSDKKWTLLAVSDDPVLASRCDRIFIMRDGVILQEGTFGEILESPHYNNVFKTTNKAEQSFNTPAG